MLTPDQIEKKLEENQRLLEAIYVNTQKTRKYILWGRIMSFIYIILIFAPLIIAAIYLPPLIKSTVGPYQELLGGFGASIGPLGKEKKAEASLNEFSNLQGLLKDFGVKVEQQPK